MVAHHEGLGGDQPGLGPDGLDLTGLIRIESDGLLAQHMLSGSEGLDGQGRVQVVRERVVDRVDIRVGEQRLVRSVGLGDSEGRGGLPGPGLVPGRERDDLAPLAGLHGRDDLVAGDLGGAQDTPSDCFLHGSYPLAARDWLGRTGPRDRMFVRCPPPGCSAVHGHLPEFPFQVAFWYVETGLIDN